MQKKNLSILGECRILIEGLLVGDTTGPGVLRIRTSYGARGGHASVSRKTKAGPIGPPFKYGVQLLTPTSTPFLG
jgi:hypothetical protein